MRIAQITDQITDNGVSMVIQNLAEGFRQAGHETHTFTWKESKSKDDQSTRVFIRGLSDKKVSFISRFFRALVGERLWFFFNSKQFSQEFTNQVDLEGYDAVLIHGLACIPLWRLSRKFFIVAHSTKSRMLLRRRQFLFLPMLKKFYSRIYQSHPVICVSEGVREDLITVFKAPPEQLYTIYNPFPVDRIREKSREPIEDVPDDYVLAVGRPVKSKRFDRLMRVYKSSGISVPLVVIVGSGKVKKVKKLASRYQIQDQVQIIGYRENPYSYMAQARLLILTSDYEGLPTVLIESLICGTPVVSTDCPSGPNEILTGELSRCLAPVDDEEKLARLIAEVYAKPITIDPLMLEKFSLHSCVIKYERVLSGHGRKNST